MADWTRDLAGKRTLVTGATRGIGEAIAEAFSRFGAKVAITGRKPE
ncbi:MAG: SDR family NAD(P)-dependent oxidoreductase, partial [Candidatus Omnitrophica bacterium]|nr:SDR family NAD(P)-dependent oxidoreductase [Candidatus Omnitrophota bacterium]